MNTICVASQAIETKEWQGQRVITLTDVDKVHQRPEGTARRNFRINKKRFIKGEDYFEISPDEIRRNKVMTVSPMLKRAMIFLTEMGYLMLVKSFTDDLAWTVQRALVQNYFRAEESATASALSEEPITKPVRKTFYQRPVMTTQDLAWLLGCTRGSVHWYVSQTGMDFPVLTGEYLAHYKHENGKQDTASSLTVYSKEHVEMILKWHHLYDKHEAFLDEYFALEHSPHMGEEDMRIAVNQAYMLFRIAREIKDPVVKEQNLKAVTALLINIGLWTEGCSGFDGVSAQWDINSAEGWNKMCVLQEAKKQWTY